MYGIQLVGYTHGFQVGLCLAWAPFLFRVDLGVLAIEIGWIGDDPV